ncbi:MAG: Hsp70 family protein, partial [Firmicutes bacterium]|nr:Hsp70 family protein [Bacillota bacterium]
ETLIYETDKNLKELEGKLDQAEVDKINAAKTALQTALESGSVQDIKDKIEALTNEYHTMSEKLYAQSQQAQGAQGQPGAGPDMGGFGGAGFNPGNMGGFGGGQGGAGAAGGQNAGGNDNVVDADFEVVDDK